MIKRLQSQDLSRIILSTPPPRRPPTSCRKLLTLQRDNHLLGRHALPLKVKPGLDVLEPLPDDLRIRRGDILAVSQSLREEILVNGLADFVVEERGAEDEIVPYASSFGLDPDVGQAGEVGNHDGEDDESFRWRLRQGVRGHGDEFVAVALGEDVQAVLGGAVTDGEGAGGRFAFEGADQVGDDGRAVVVEGLARAELFDVVEVLRGAGGDDFVAGRDGELDGVAADARGAAPDEQGLAGRLWGGGWVLESQLVLLE